MAKVLPEYLFISFYELYSGINLESVQKENHTTTPLSADESKPLKVTLADDDSEDQELFEQALERTGINTELTVVDNGKELLENLKDPKQENPDIIFLDINMPVKDGRETLKEIKKDEELKEIPTVMLSTSDHPKEVKEAFEAGASVYVTKPATFRSFVLILKKIFSFHWAGLLLRPVWQRFFISERNTHND